MKFPLSQLSHSTPEIVCHAHGKSTRYMKSNCARFLIEWEYDKRLITVTSRSGGRIRNQSAEGGQVLGQVQLPRDRDKEAILDAVKICVGAHAVLSRSR